MSARPNLLINIRRRLQRHGRVLLLSSIMSLGLGSIALAAIAPDVRNTRHNLSVSSSQTAAPNSSFSSTTLKATSEDQICVFCHTPHAATQNIVAPLWNRALSTAGYTFYNSSSIDVTPIPGTAGVGDGSKMCLSCHDGTLAIGTVGVLNARAPVSITMQGTGGGGVMASGLAGATSGFTRNIGTNLTNDHPISFTYNAALADADGEMYTPGASGVAVAGRLRGQRPPQFPLIGATNASSGQMECITCHDPHLKTDSVDPVSGRLQNNKFLRGNRFQLESPVVTDTGIFDPAEDIICLACHNKPTWATSTHSNREATSEQYTDTAADLRDFPRGISTWRAACVNCHDMHTVQGSRRLLREAVTSDAAGNAFPSPRPGSTFPAIERVCFQCHSPAAERILVQDVPDQVPDIKTDFTTMTYRMPLVPAEQGQVPAGGFSSNTGNTQERHDIGVKASLAVDVIAETNNAKRGIDFVEPRSLLGAGNLNNRHAECTDCHQPHRVTRTQLFNADPTVPSITGTHRHASSRDSGGVPHNNLASGSQRGAFGVEPVYTSNSFFVSPSSFVEKRGAAGTGVSTAVNSTYLTREYQICAKCHSNYSLDTSLRADAPLPSLGRIGGSPWRTNGMRIYTNIFREIQAPVSHRGNSTPNDSGAHKGLTRYVSPASNYTVDFQIRNRRSWHPVMGPTGRTLALRGMTSNSDNWLAPWVGDIGTLTMYCTDCHGSNTAAATVVPTGGVDGAAWGPHGSINIFLLKGWWDQCTGSNTNVTGCLTSSSTVSASSPANTAVRPTNDTRQDLCFKCHRFSRYGEDGGGSSGFAEGGGGNLHGYHVDIMNGRLRCMWCHIAVPHGWKNKAFLVNLNDLGPEATCRGTEDEVGIATGYRCGQNVGYGNPMLPGTQVTGPGYTNPPYYRNAMLKITTFGASGNWSPNNCGSVGRPGNGDRGVDWMQSNESCDGGVP